MYKNKIISTGVKGLDELLYGGLHISEDTSLVPKPCSNINKDNNCNHGICIAIYGDRGISRHDLAMQIMYNVQREIYKEKEFYDGIKLYDLAQSKDTLKNKLIALHIENIVSQIKNKTGNSDLNDYLYGYELNKFYPHISGESLQEELKNGNIEYDFRTLSLIIKKERLPIEESYKEKIMKEIDRAFIQQEKDSLTYLPPPTIMFKDIQKELQTLNSPPKENNEKADNEKPKCNTFPLSAIVIGGFTVFDENLSRLPFDDLIHSLRKNAKVSILVLDKRAPELHLDVDIMIEMRQREDIRHDYTFHELSIIKSDLQQHVHGWHKYKKHRNYNVEVFPSTYAQITPACKSSYEFHQQIKAVPEDSNGCCRIEVNTYENGSEGGRSDGKEINTSNADEDATKGSKGECTKDRSLIVLFGRRLQSFCKRVTVKAPNNMDYFEVDPGSTYAEEVLVLLKEYISNWVESSKEENLHIYIDDLAQLDMYPFVKQSTLFLPTLFAICKNNKNIQLHLYSSTKECHHWQMARKVEEWAE